MILLWKKTNQSIVVANANNDGSIDQNNQGNIINPSQSTNEEIRKMLEDLRC